MGKIEDHANTAVCFVDWASDPYYPGGWTPNSYNEVFTFTPMLWSNADALTSIWNANVQNAINNYGTDAVLAFNEPDVSMIQYQTHSTACLSQPTLVAGFRTSETCLRYAIAAVVGSGCCRSPAAAFD